MNRYVIIRDFNHPFVKAKIRKARNLEEINEFSTPEEVAAIAAYAAICELRRQLDLPIEPIKPIQKKSETLNLVEG